MADARTIELRWNSVPAEVKATFSPLLSEHLWILPSWVEVMNIEFVAQQDTTSLQVKCCEEYRSLYLNIMPNWLAQEESVRSRDVQHELLHVNANPLHAFGLQVIDATMTKDSALWTWAHEQLRLAVEKAACDLENMLQRIPQ